VALCPSGTRQSSVETDEWIELVFGTQNSLEASTYPTPNLSKKYIHYRSYEPDVMPVNVPMYKPHSSRVIRTTMFRESA